MKDIGRRAAIPLALVALFVTMTLVFSACQATPAPRTPTAPTCDAACHAQGLAQIQHRIEAKVSALTKGHQCYPVDPPRLTKYVIVRGALIGTERVTRITFDDAWALNHDASKSNDVWLLARCD